MCTPVTTPLLQQIKTLIPLKDLFNIYTGICQPDIEPQSEKLKEEDKVLPVSENFTPTDKDSVIPVSKLTKLQSYQNSQNLRVKGIEDKFDNYLDFHFQKWVQRSTSDKNQSSQPMGPFKNFLTLKAQLNNQPTSRPADPPASCVVPSKPQPKKDLYYDQTVLRKQRLASYVEGFDSARGTNPISHNLHLPAPRDPPDIHQGPLKAQGKAQHWQFPHQHQAHKRPQNPQQDPKESIKERPLGNLEHTPARQRQELTPGSGRGRRALDRARTPRDRSGGEHHGGEGGGGGRPTGHVPIPEPGDLPRQLVIQIDPSIYGINDLPNQTADFCYAPSIKRIAELHTSVIEEYDFDWFNDLNTQHFFGLMIARYGHTELPGFVRNHSIDDFFEYNQEGTITGSKITTNINECLTGVSLFRPYSYKTHYDHLDVSERPNDCKLRSALVKMRFLIQHLIDSNINVVVEYRFGSDPNGAQNLMIYSDQLIKGPVYDAFKEVSVVLDDVFRIQQAAYQVGQSLNDLRDEKIELFEQSYCEFVLLPDSSDKQKFREDTQQMLKSANGLTQNYRTYEELASKMYQQSCLTQVATKAMFKNQSYLIHFFLNSSDPTLPFIRSPRTYTTVTSQCNVENLTVNVLSSPSRIYVPKSYIGIDDLVQKVKDLVDKAINQICKATSPTSPRVAHHGATTQKEDSQTEYSYPDILIEDASNLLIQIQDKTGIEDASKHFLLSAQRKCQDISKEIHSLRWKRGLHLKPTDKEIYDQINSASDYLGEIIAKTKDKERMVDLEQRELSKSIASVKPIYLATNASNITQYLEYHSNFKSANKLQRSIKLKEGLPQDMRSRVTHESDPDEIIKYLTRMYLSEDFQLPMSRAEISALPSSPSISSKAEQIAFSKILTFINKLKHEGMEDRLDFTTISIAESKISKQRRHEWQRSWLEKSEHFEGLSARKKEDIKRELFVKFVTLHENLIAREIVQASFQEKDSKVKDKEEKVFAIKTTKHDKRKEKFAEQRKDDRTSFTAESSALKTNSTKMEDYTCPLCNEKVGHPNTKGMSAKSVARCPILKDAHQSQKLDIVLQCGACSRCLASWHQVHECKVSPDTEWLKHSDCNHPQGHHNGIICPLK